jgi:putative DNA primase/helicase
MKSPAQNEGLRALKKIASEHLNDFQAATIEWKATETVIISQKKGIEERLREIAKKGENDPSESNRLRDQLMQLESRLQNEKPRARRLYTSDGTVEKISEILVDNPNGILINRDELYGFLKANDKPGREGDRAFYLESWNGYGEFTVDRIGRGTILVPALCLSILGGIQPGRLQQYVAEASGDGAGDDGLIQRFQLLVWPEFSKDWKNIDRPPNEEAAKRLERLFRDLVELKLESVGATWNEEGDPPYLRFAPDAQEAFNLWLEKLESRLRGEDLGSPALDAHLGKYRKLMPALALIFHVLDVLSTGKSGSGVSLNAVQLAERWCSHLELHARKVYGLLEAAPVSGAQELLKRIRSGAVKDRARVRSIYRRHWTGLNSEEAVNDALDVLEQYGWVKREVDRETGGAPSVLIRIHPTLNNGGVA